MASDPKDPRALPPSDAADHRKVKLLCSYGGKILPRHGDGALRYAGGETRLITVRRDSLLPEILRKMAEACGGPIVLRYQLPDEDLDALISVSTTEDLDNMMEEYDRLAADSPSAKIRVFLFSPCEVTGAGAASFAVHIDLQETGTRYLEAVNGLDSSIRRKDSATSFSSTRNSDGTTAADDEVNNEGTSPAHVSPTAGSAQDKLKSVFAGQDVLDLLPPTTSSSEQTELLSSTQSEWPPLVPDQNRVLNSTQTDFPSVASYVPQSYIDPQQAQMLNPQYLPVMGLPLPINVVRVPAPAYMPPSHIGDPMFQVSNGTSVQTKVNPHSLNSNVDKTAKFPSDVKLQSLSQLPPLPSPYLLAPNVERSGLRQVSSLSQGHTIRFEDCNLCQKALPHAHSDPLIKEQGNGLRNVVPEANVVLQSHHSEDLTSIRAQQMIDVGMLVDSVVETQAENLVATAPSKTYEFSETIPGIPWDSGRPVVVNAANPYYAKVFVPPVSVCLPGTSQASHGTVTNPQKAQKVESVQEQQEVPLSLGPNMENLDYPNISLAPASSTLPRGPYGLLIIPQLHGEDYLQQQTQLPQHIELPNYPVDHNFIVANTSSVRNSDYREVGQSVNGTVPAYLFGYVRPINGTHRAICTIPPGDPGFSNQPRPVVIPDIGTSKNIKPEKPPLVVVNTHNAGPQHKENEFSHGDPRISSVVVPEGNAGPQIDKQLSVISDVAYVQSVQPSNSSHIPNMTCNHGPYSYHLEAGIGPRGMFKYVDPTCNNNAIKKNIIGEQKDEVPSLHPVEVFFDITIPQSDSAQLYTIHHASNMNQIQRAISLDPLVSSKDPQETLTVLPPIPSEVSNRESIAMKELYNKNSVNSMGSEVTVPAGVSSHLPESPRMDSPKELVCSLKEDVHIKQDIQTFEGKASAPALQSSEVPVPVLISHETEEVSPSSNRESGTIENTLEKDDDQSEAIKTKQSENLKNGFPITDDIGHLQVIKNSDLEELQELGSGTFGTVYHGKWRGSDVAIKRINDRVFAGKPSEQERARADFWSEACKLASLHHPNVVAFYGIVLDGPGGSIATVTEFMVNGSLRRASQKNQKILDRRRSLLIAMDVAFGMEYLHNKNIIHFDLKSDNLLVNLRDPQRPICKVGDLGLSKVKYETLMSGGMQGTLRWMAPELLSGKDNKYTEKVDVFSFGIVMWELITGEEPYGDMHYGAIIGGILNDTLRPPVPESCDSEWGSLMEQCWSTEPSQRPSFTDIASRLRAMAAALPQKG
ncbi:hypothetical protein C4D60_Mb03t00790 [Musa balbisiana]|uniref:Protein kinase domain-containing protein n=1 Tax=Musa balbisiana TaxID=52838 RepID=A0A4S8J6N2_MUSBA|nr:hypothetical protein C4D60_Mb03t00790 [Musa balbisiana]